MNRSIIMTLEAGLLAAVLVCGCQSVGGGPCDEELIDCTMADWKTALIAQDLDKVMAAYSEDYTSTRGGKDSVREFMTRVFEEGYLDNAKVNLEKVEITIEEDKAEFGPVEFISDRGTFRLEYILHKEDKAWLIVGSRVVEQ